MEEGEDKANKEKIMFIESSAKAGFNIKALFRKLAIALPGVESAPVQTSQNCKLLRNYTYLFMTVNNQLLIINYQYLILNLLLLM